jgi:thiol-disulfide isomerase/thioredoxin
VKLPENKPLFFDFWATWCTPCVAAFGFNRDLDTFLINKNIERVYVSFDGIYSYAKWREAINKYALGGYHILANDSLKDDIKHIIYHEKGKNDPMGIPRYVLVNKGKVVIDDAISPTELDLLKKQIVEVLNL